METSPAWKVSSITMADSLDVEKRILIELRRPTV